VSAAVWMDEHKSVQALARVGRERAPQLLVVALLLALSVDAALILTRSLSSPVETSATGPVAAPPPPRRGVNPTLELANIVNAHLFGSAASTATTDVPATTMPLILAGVIAEQDPARGQAIIGESTANAKLYAVGAAIPGGARLHAVYGDRVIIERNGSLEALMLPRTSAALATFQAAPAPPPVRDNSTLLAGLVRVQPVFAQGKLSGYRIFPGGARGNTAFNQMGLRPGDLITAVNGTSLDDPTHAMEVLQTLSSAGSATVTVSRNGTPQEVNLNLATLSQDAEAGGGADNANQPPVTPPTVPPLLRNRLGGPRGNAAADGSSATPSDDSARDR